MSNIRSPLSLAGLLLSTALMAQTPPPSPPIAAIQNTPSTQLGRLFLTPERRATLERQRQFNIAETLAAESDAIAINGIVQRSNGASTVWVNQRAQDGNKQDEALKIQTSRKQTGTLNVQSGDAPATNLKVGESLNRSTQERNDILAPGAIRVGKTRP